MLSDILDVSEKHNVRDGITSVLMYHDGIFFQVLEGDRDAVKACFQNRINRDHRHGNLSLIWADEVESRTFSEWAIGYLGPDEIGKHTEATFTSLGHLSESNTVSNVHESVKDQDDLKDQNAVALDLVQAMFSDFRRRS